MGNEYLENFSNEMCEECGQKTVIYADMITNGEKHRILINSCVDCELKRLEEEHMAEQNKDMSLSYAAEAFLTDEEKLAKLLWHPKVRKTIARIVELDKENDESQVKKG